MKMMSSDFEALKARLEPIVAKIPTEKYRQKGLTHACWRWDVFWTAHFNDGAGHLYLYLNDHHIDTALRAILGHKFEDTEST